MKGAVIVGSKKLLERGNEERLASWSIRTRLIVSFTILFMSVMVLLEAIYFWGVPFTQVIGRRNQERSEVFKNLDLVADMKKERLLRWIEERRDDLMVTADNEFTRINASLVLEAFHGFVTMGVEGTELWARVQGEESSRFLLKYLENMASVYGVYDRIQIVDAKTGAIVLSTDESDLGSNESKRPYFTETQIVSNTYTSYATLFVQEKQPVLHLARPVHDGSGKVIAILVMEVNIDDVLKPTLHTGEGLGQNGEAFLVNQDVNILTSLKHPLRDGSHAEPLKYRIEAEPAVRAARGDEGVIESLDYRGESVLASYRHIIISPDVRWGLVVKQDKNELFAPIRREESFIVLIGLIGIFVTIAATIMLTGKITRPIQELGHLAERVSRGDLGVKANVKSLDEVGVLAQTFNSMVQKVGNWRFDLEEAVKKQTTELRRVNKNLGLALDEQKQAETVQSVLFQISQVSRLLYTKNIYIALYDKKKDLYSFPYCVDEREELSEFTPQQLRKSLTDYVRRKGKPILVDAQVHDQLMQKGEVDLVGEYSAVWLGVPLKGAKSIIGVIALQHYTDPGAYTEKDLDLMTFVSDHITMAIERKSTEEKLKLSQFTIDNSVDSMFWIGPDSRILHINDFACKKLGYSREELLSMTIHDINPNFPEEVWQARREELREKGSFTVESVHRTKNGREFPVEITANYFEFEGQEYNFTFVRDITERKRIDRMKDEFISTVSHELRTPLTSIHGSIDLINQGKAGELPGKARYLLEIAGRNSNRLRELIENLRIISRLENNSTSNLCSMISCPT
jgi:PAS domain S-box-containing protein